VLDGIGRKIKDGILNPLGKAAASIMGPNAWTTFSLLLGIASAILIAFDLLLWAGIAWGLNRITDGIDGTVARVSGKQSDWGGYYDIMVDFVIYALIPIGFAWRAQDPFLWQATVVLLAVFYVNGASWLFLSGLLEKRGRSVRGQTSLQIPTGVVGGTETILFYTAFFFFTPWLGWVFLGMAGLTFLGIPLRLFWARKALKIQPKPSDKNPW
jgi:phosphatidylserine synthase